MLGSSSKGPFGALAALASCTPLTRFSYASYLKNFDLSVCEVMRSACEAENSKTGFTFSHASEKKLAPIGSTVTLGSQYLVKS
jgi:hypothetical protein